MEDRDYSERLASISRIVAALRGRAPSPTLVDELVLLVAQLQQDLDAVPDDRLLARRLRRASLEGAAVAEVSAGRARTGPGRPVEDRWSGRVHGVHFARTHAHAVAAVVDMVTDALDESRIVLVVATGLHRRWIENELHQRRVELCGARFHAVDAAASLSSVLVDGIPDRERFRTLLGGLVSDASSQSAAGVSVYGEMVGLLWEAGDVVAAMRLEHLWNELQRELSFSLMCGYLLDRHTSRGELDPIRRLHSHVM